MSAEKLKIILAVGETVGVEFKRCGNSTNADTYEMLCSFLNIKQNIFTEKKVYPYACENDLRLDLLPPIRQRAVNRFQDHEWKNMIDGDVFLMSQKQ